MERGKSLAAVTDLHADGTVWDEEVGQAHRERDGLELIGEDVLGARLGGLERQS